jgi:hypothetical protein
VENLSQKINGKLGGINSVINTKLALSRSSNDDLFMFFGADVSVIDGGEKRKSYSFISFRSLIRHVPQSVHRLQQ